MSGLRGANKAIFNSDLIVCLGNHLPIPQTTTLYKNYASQAKKIIINIDQNQLKNLNVKFDIKINLDCNFFKKIKIKKKKYYDWYSEYKKYNWYEPKKDKYVNFKYFYKKAVRKY